MKDSWVLDPSQAVGSAIVGIASMIAGLTLWMSGRYAVAACILICIGVATQILALILASRRVSIRETGVTVRVLGKKICSLAWDEVAEVCMLGRESRLDKFTQSRIHVHKYVYFSKENLNDDSRYVIYQNWPPRGMIYFRYNPEALERLQLYWRNRLTYYNILD